MTVRTRDRDRVLDAPAPLDVIDAAGVVGNEAGARVRHFPGFLHCPLHHYEQFRLTASAA